MTSVTNKLSKSLGVAVSSSVERIGQFLDDSATLTDSFVTNVDQNYGNDHHIQPVFETVVTIFNLPPLDQITICSESCSDNTSICDVSSITTDENDEMNQFFSTSSTSKKVLPCPSPTFRTIFDRYWGKNRPVQFVTTAPDSKTEPVSPLRIDEEEEQEISSINTYERKSLQSQGKAVMASEKNSLSRRRIFQDLPVTPNLLVDDWRSRPTIVRSDPCLLTKKAKPPCLRQSRFSVSSSSHSQPHCRRASSSSSVTSVTFNPKVDVVVFRKPVEHFASNGWSDYFIS